MQKLQEYHWAGNIRELQHTIEEVEKALIINSLNRNKGNYSLAAEELGITRPTLYNKVRKYGIL
jgi:transcriptional regulator with PAS, ATPase and Fis domain